MDNFCRTYLLTDIVAWPTWNNLKVYIVTFDLLLPIKILRFTNDVLYGMNMKYK